MIQLLSKIAKKGNSAFNVAVTFFLFAGSMAVLAYFIQSAKYIFIFLGILIYCFSFIFRKIIFGKENKTHYSELAFFFISFLFLGYLLDLLKLDKNIKNYFPSEILALTGISFLLIFFINFFSGSGKSSGKNYKLVLFLIVFFTLGKYQNEIKLFMSNNHYISDFIIGTPIIYLGFLLTGLNNYISKIKKNI